GLSYQWYHGTSPDIAHLIGGATSSTYTPTLIGNTKFWVRVSSGPCSADSNTATVTVDFTDTLVARTTAIKAYTLTSRGRASMPSAPLICWARSRTPMPSPP